MPHSSERPPDALALDLGHSYRPPPDEKAWQVDVGDLPNEDLPQAGPSVPPPVPRILEALLFVGGPPLTEQRAREAVRGMTPAEFTQALDTLNRAYRLQGRPYTIRSQDQGYVLALRPRFRPVLEKLYGS